MIICPSRNPRSDVRGPTTSLNEKVSPGWITVPSMKSAIRWTLWMRFEDETPISVVNETSLRRMPSAIARWVLPVPGGPRNTTLSLAVTKSRVPRCAMVSAFERAGVLVVELLQGLAGREPGGPDPALPAVGLPRRDFALQAGDEELLV